ncbi:MAG TPA: 30S ribosomal protein S8 [Myxococcota bacterium]|nr:30S ribosomal protein S8 [Myxococcota bacterium]
MTDPIADFLTRIRNAQAAGHANLVVPRSKLKLELLKVLKHEGFIEGYVDDASESHQGILKVFLKYDASRDGSIRGLTRISKPGRRVYVGRDEVPSVRNGLGIAILTTPKGVLTDRQARAHGVGGEVLCHVW